MPRKSAKAMVERQSVQRFLRFFCCCRSSQESLVGVSIALDIEWRGVGSGDGNWGR